MLELASYVLHCLAYALLLLFLRASSVGRSCVPRSEEACRVGARLAHGPHCAARDAARVPGMNDDDTRHAAHTPYDAAVAWCATDCHPAYQWLVCEDGGDLVGRAAQPTLQRRRHSDPELELAPVNSPQDGHVAVPPASRTSSTSTSNGMRPAPAKTRAEEQRQALLGVVGDGNTVAPGASSNGRHGKSALHRMEHAAGRRCCACGGVTVAVHRRAWLLLLPAVVFTTLLPYLVARSITSPKHDLTFQIILGIARSVIDAAFLLATATTLIALTLLCAHARLSTTPTRARWLRRFYVLTGLTLVILTTYTSVTLARRVSRVDTVAELQRGILSDHVDPCAAEGTVLRPSLARSWVWPAITPRRLFNFFTGSESCHDEHWRSIGYIDAESDTLVVSAQCADGSRPRIFLDRPERSELSGMPTVRMPETKRANEQYQRELEQLYGTAALAVAAGVVVHRDPRTGLIRAVEVEPGRLVRVPRIARTPAESAARRHWPSPRHVLELPLGRSAAYSVWCAALDHEEYFVYPLLPVSNASTSSTSSSSSLSSTSPASSVLMIVFDAVSRQEVARSLPRFTAWLRGFQARQRAKPATQPGHHVIEAQAHTTLEHSTAGNFVPYLAGTTSAVEEDSSSSTSCAFDAVGRSVFDLAKVRHGDGLSTAFTTGYCADFFEDMLGFREPSSGRGGRITGVDHYLFQPFCHLDYSGVHSNFQGQYSILRRCIDGRYVHEHALDYTAYLLQHQLQRRHSSAEYFFDLSYFIEGHEGTHGVLALVDDALTAFMDKLSDELRFFDNPLNSFIFAADHGNHMGHYYELTRAGQFERTTPAMVYIIHPEVMRRVDAHKRRTAGTSEANFLARTKRLTTPLDLYMTLSDLMNVEAQPHSKYVMTSLPPTSLFDARADNSFVTNCSAFKTSHEKSKCTFDFCLPRVD